MVDARAFVDRPVGDLAAATVAAEIAAERWELGVPAFLRRGMNALFVCGDVVIRVGDTNAHPALAHRLAQVMSARGIATVRPIAELSDVIEGLGVTAWERVGRSGSAVDWERVGAAVRLVHDISLSEIPEGYPVPSPLAFPWWDFRGLLDEVGSEIDAPALNGLRAAVERHEGWHTEVGAGAVVCHGDVHPGNVLMSGTVPLLIDWDLLCTAAPAWDHAMLTTYADRWGGAAATYGAFAHGYGASFADDPLAQSLGDLRNVAATLMRVRAGRADPAAAAEAERRLRYWRGDPDAPVWRAQ